MQALDINARAIYWRAVLKEDDVHKNFGFFILGECKLNIKKLNTAVRVRNSNKKARCF